MAVRLALKLDLLAMVIPGVTGAGFVRRAAGAAKNVLDATIGTYRSLKWAGQSDAHHIIQNAAVRQVAGYNYRSAPAIYFAVADHCI